MYEKECQDVAALASGSELCRSCVTELGESACFPLRQNTNKRGTPKKCLSYWYAGRDSFAFLPAAEIEEFPSVRTGECNSPPDCCDPDDSSPFLCVVYTKKAEAKSLCLFGTPEGTRLHFCLRQKLRDSPVCALGNAICHWHIAFYDSSSPFLCVGIPKRQAPARDACLFGTPEGTRTPDLLVRSQSLYPTELPAHTTLSSSALL